MRYQNTSPDAEFSLDTRGRRRPEASAGPALSMSVIALFVAVLALVLALILHGCSSTGPLSQNCGVTTSVPGATGATGPAGATGANGLSAYELWLAVGNDGTLQQFLDSLVGTPQPVTNIYIGSDGVTGTPGTYGKSAYQLWLDAGNTGTSQEFLDSLVGHGGADGAAGLSAYELWILEDNDGDIDDFFDSLVGGVGPSGSPGPSGAPGATGLSAYDIYVLNGGEGGVAGFLESLRGPAGPAGEPGQCLPGATGAAGANGLSAYDIWKLQGNAGSEALFLLSLIGPSGSAGPQGSRGPQGLTGSQGPIGETGPMGPAGTSGLGDSGSFWDLTTQGASGTVSTGINTAYPMYFNSTDASANQGVSVTSGAGDASGRASYITFTHPGVYSIAFSAQLLRTQGGSADTVSIWLRQDGTNVPNSNTDVTLVANGQKQVAAWNFFVTVSCTTTCTNYQLMWSADGAYTNIWYQDAQTNPDRPAIPSIILTVNQVK